tara:strand:- start:335 stop:571 length:237 start_codon:yes stop_codon:yes gene_type:complete
MDDKNKNRNLSLFDGWAFGRTNYIIFTLGLLSLILGYYLMFSGSVNSFQSLTLSPILLFLGYIIIIPFALVYREKIDK